MIGRQHRFHGHNSLSFVYKQGQTVRQGPLVLRYAKNSRRTSYRVAVVVSRKISKSAVTRNRIRRRVYEQVRLVGLPDGCVCDLVFTAFSDQLAVMPAAELEVIVRSLLSKIASA